MRSAAWVYCESAAASMPMVLSLPVVLAGAARLPYCPLMTPGTFGADSPLPLPWEGDPRMQRPFVSDRSQAERLLHSLDVDAREIATYLIKKLPLSRSRTLLDVGGGLGSFSVAFCRHYPNLRATLVEHPHVLPLARRAIVASGMARKVHIVGADFSRDALPQGFDTVFVSNVLHAHGVAVNHSLLRKLQRCLNPHGQLIVRDVFMNRQRTAPEWSTLFSVLLLLHTPQGRCYALDEIRTWLRQAGFSRIRGPFRSSPLPFDPDSVLIATKTDRR